MNLINCVQSTLAIGYYSAFRRTISVFGVRTRVLLTRSPLTSAERWYADKRRYDADLRRYKLNIRDHQRIIRDHQRISAPH